jgi:hypothetical protein
VKTQLGVFRQRAKSKYDKSVRMDIRVLIEPISHAVFVEGQEQKFLKVALRKQKLPPFISYAALRHMVVSGF